MAGGKRVSVYINERARRGNGKKEIALCTERCKGCYYMFRMQDIRFTTDNENELAIACDYVGKTGHSRGCSAGDECTCFRPRGDYRGTKKRNTTWNS